MLALIAALCFILALFKVDLGEVNLVTLGLLFVALHLAFGFGIPYLRRDRTATTP